MRKSSFPPVVDPRTRVLVLGSLPGERSLSEQRYYAFPQNAFWRLMEAVLEEPVAVLGFDERLAVLLRRGVGLWDCVGEAVRPGSLDSDIRDVEPNDLGGLARTLPDLRAAAFNGGTSAKLGTPLLAHAGLELLKLPSSSPAHAGRTFAQKAEAWAALRAFVRPVA